MILKRLLMIGIVVQQNAFYRQHLDYRDLPDVPPISLSASERVALVESVDQLFGGL